MDGWYAQEEKRQLWAQREWPWAFEPDLLKAVQERNVTVQNAFDIPDLNFKNTTIFEGGEIGGSVNNEFSYNKDSAIFKDPAMHYRVSSNGTVMSWPKTQAA